MRNKIILSLKISIIAAIIALTALVYFQQGDFTSIDLGRHLKNGQIVISQPDVLFKNLYSYTEPDFPFVNHHWLSGVIFWLLYLIGGFNILSVFNIILGILTILIVFKLAVRKSDFALTGVLALPVILILSERVDIRPEMFSNLFMVLTFYLLDDFRSTKSTKNLYWLLPIFFLWVNTHLYFFIGLFLIGLAVSEQIIIQHKNFFRINYAKKLVYFFFGSIVICLLNPNFWNGLVYPFTIMGKYFGQTENYEIVENKSPFFLEKLMINNNILIFKILLVLLAVSFIAYFVKKLSDDSGRSFKERLAASPDYFYLFSALFFSAFAVLYIRNLPAFGLVALPIMANNFYVAAGVFKEKTVKYAMAGLVMLFFMYAGVFVWLIYDNYGARIYLNKNLGLGVSQNSLVSIKFYKDNNLHGPIFNNFDIGSALDFWLYPTERVFVDNRPDIFSREFFKQIYIPMQNDLAKWNTYSEQYKINLIYFSHTDGTPWAREFLATRLKDANWPLIYFDDYTVIMVKNNDDNKAVIEKYKIDDGKFALRLNELLAGAHDNEKLHLADLAVTYGRIDLAENIYQAILAKRPEDAKILAALGFLAAGGGSREAVLKSINYFNQALDNGYILPGVYNQLGLDYWNLADYTEAKNMWQKALRLDSNNEHAKYYLNQANGLIK